MKTKILAFILLVAICLSAVALTGCELAKPMLDVPFVVLDGDAATWQPIDGAEFYDIEVNGNIYRISPSVTRKVLAIGDTIRVRAVAGEDGRDSDWSLPIKYKGPSGVITPTKLLTPIVTIDESGVATWDAIEGAVGYVYSLNGEATEHQTTGLSVTLSVGDMINVKAIGNGVVYISSDWSVGRIYEDNTPTPPTPTPPTPTPPTPPTPTKLTTPVVSVSEGGVASWAAISGAVSYKYQIDGASPITTTALSVQLSVGQSIRVMAVGDGASYTDSDWSADVAYTYTPPTPTPTKLNAPVISISEGGVASWAAISGAVSYKYQIDGGTATRTTSLTKQLSIGQSLRVMAEGDGVNYTDSDWSAAVTYTYTPPTPHTHTDKGDDGVCDSCNESVIVVVDFYAINDLHGKFCDTETQPGVDELATFLKGREDIDDNVVVLSSGDMWQGAAESNLTYGAIITEWMNEVGFVSMTLGNHEYDWGAEYIEANLKIANFPFLAINIYDTSTGKLADYCTPSILIEEGGIQIGIIGAIGDCYSSIHSDMSAGIQFKTGSALTSLVKAEATRLREAGADIIVYSLHDGQSGYDTSLSNGYVDLVFEGHTHQGYAKTDSYGVYHLQNGGENEGISHAEVGINSVTGTVRVSDAKVIQNSEYKDLADDAGTEAIEDKYAKEIDMAYTIIGRNDYPMNDSQIEDIVAKLYYEAGVKRWGDRYDIVLGGGFLKLREPYKLPLGELTYANVLSTLPFDNELVLCSVLGSNLLSKFINTSNSDYHIYLGDGITAGDIVSSKTYYIIVDSYTSTYTSNRLTEIERYGADTYARDLLADYIKEGNLALDHTKYTPTSISDILNLKLESGEQTSEFYYAEGTVTSVANSEYGRFYIKDASGNSLYIYGSQDTGGTAYQDALTKPKVGDRVVLFGSIKNYSGTVEMINAVWISIN